MAIDRACSQIAGKSAKQCSDINEKPKFEMNLTRNLEFSAGHRAAVLASMAE